MWNYSKKVMDHFLNPRNAGELEDASAVGEVGSLACGDALRLAIKVDPETQRITEARFLTFGCGSAIASASALTEMVRGKTLDEAAAINEEDVATYLDGLPAEKMHCSVMGTDALRAAIGSYRGEPLNVDASDEVICQCFGVTRHRIEAIAERHQARTVEEITHYTKAAGACGTCRDKISAILAALPAPSPTACTTTACAKPAPGELHGQLVQLSR